MRSAEIARVNLPVAGLVWLMIIPMLLKIDFGALGQVREHWRGVGVTLFINWAVKPFSMALLGSIFIGHLFAPWLPAAQIPSYIAGLILLAAAPCTAMVFVWSNLCEGEPHYTLSQVALNDVIMVFAFAPLVGLLAGRGLDHRALGDPADIGGAVHRRAGDRRAAMARALLRRGPAALQRTLHALQPVSLVALLTTLVLLFGFQGEQIIAQPLVIVLLAVPILIQVYLNAGLAYWLSRRFGVAWCVAAPAALIGASNFFELAVAAAISLFGLNSGAALATVVGVLVEVPVMLSVVYLVKASRGWYEAGADSVRHGQGGGAAMTVTIYHNPACGTSRNTLAMIRQSGEEPEVIEYLKTPPSRARLVELIAALGISPRALLREKGTPYAELGLADPKWSDDELIDFMLAHPILINRPIVVTPKGVRLCRPSELVLDLLDKPVQSFVKEDGEAVTRAKG